MPQSSSPAVFILERNRSHLDPLLGHIAFLSKEFPVYVGIHPSFLPYIKPLKEVVEVFPFPLKNTSFSLSAYKMFSQLLREKKIEILLLNTAHGKEIRNLLYFLPSSLKIVGTLHFLHLLKGFRFTQWGIHRKVNRYFVLSRYLETLWKDRSPVPLSGISFFTLPPSFLSHLPTITPEEGTIRVAIPGAIEKKRRSYEELIQWVSDYRPEGIQFLFLGDGSGPNTDLPLLKKQIQEKRVEDWFITFDRFVPPFEFGGHLQSSQWILPLIHPSTPEGEGYLRYRISGSFLLAFLYKKPLLLHRYLFPLKEYHPIARYYSSPKELFSILKSPPPPFPSLDYTYEQERYIQFVKVGG